MPSGSLNLSAIDEAFGEKADLYRDVLRIKSNVSTDDVQQAYFSRRDELFQILAQMDQSGVPSDSPQRYQVERQMDAVVMCLRVLGDPDARMQYDAIRRDRVVGRKVPAMHSRTNGSNTGEEVPLGTSTSVSQSDKSSKSNSPRRRRLKSALKKNKSVDSHERSVTINKTNSVEYIGSAGESDDFDYPDPSLALESRDEVSGPSKTSKTSRKENSAKLTRKGFESVKSTGSGSRMSTKRKTRKVTPPRDDSREFKTHKVDDDNASQGSFGTTFSAAQSRRTMLQVMKDELVGVFEDTSRSFEQVFGAFTLQDEEIQAVFGRIDKAKLQMVNEFTA